MKTIQKNKFMSHQLICLATLLLFGLLFSPIVRGQEEGEAVEADKKAVDKPVRAPFESAYLFDNQSVVVLPAKTLEFIMQHRFGLVDNGISDIWGIYGPANIRLGLTYSVIDNLSIGFGTTKNKKYQDFSLKYAIIQQTRSGKTPVSVTYYGNMAIDARKDDNFINTSDRFSYFHQVIVSRKITSNFSLQVAPSLSHFNAMAGYVSEGEIQPQMENNHIAIATGGRYKITPQTAIILNYDQPITEHFTNNPHPNLSFGVEIATSSHAFQLFMGNYNGIVPQENNVFNSNDFRDGEFLIGFNITRSWNF